MNANAASAPVRCLVVDDEPLAISVLARFIAATPTLELTATARHAFEAFELLHQQAMTCSSLLMPSTCPPATLPAFFGASCATPGFRPAH